MQQPRLHDRHRDKNGEISRKHGNTLVRTLRKIYGRISRRDAPIWRRYPTCCISSTNPA